LKKLEKELSEAEEKRLVTSGELQRREDTIVDLTNFKDRLEQLAEKRSGKANQTAIQVYGGGGDEEDDSGALLNMQKTLREEQDQHLESLSHVLSRQKQLGQMIGDELDLQSELLDDLDTDLDRTKGKMSRTMRTLDTVGKAAKSRKGTVAIVLLIVAIIIVIIVISVTKSLV
jgi:t-SNARE complex subunit (syntaxin)